MKDDSATVRPRWLRPEDFARLYGIPVEDLKAMRRQGIGPPWFRISKRRIAYHLESVEAWRSKQERKAADEAKIRAEGGIEMTFGITAKGPT